MNIKQKKFVISTGFAHLENALKGGFSAGNLYVIKGAQSVGKTALVISLAKNISDQKSNVIKTAIINLNISSDNLKQRILANYSEVPLEKIVKQDMTISSDLRIMSSFNQFTIKTNNEWSLKEISNDCINFVQNGCDIVFIDGIYSSKHKRYSLVQIVTHLKKLAVHLNIPIVLTFRTTTSFEQLQKLLLQHWKNYLSMSKYCDFLLFLYRPEFYDLTFGETHVYIANKQLNFFNSIGLKAMLHIQKFESYS